jgi:hypothetical protein
VEDVAPVQEAPAFPSPETTAAIDVPIIKEAVVEQPVVKDDEPAPGFGEDGIPTVGQRLLGVFFDPRETFAKLDERAGWLVPWLLIMGAGLLVGTIALAKIDFAAIVKQQMELNAQPGAPPEALEMGGRIGVFMARISLFVVPILGSLLGALVVSGVMFGLSTFLGGRPHFLRAFVVTFHAALVVLVRDVAALIGIASGNPFPMTNPTHLAHGHLWGGWALGWLDPVFWWWVVLLGIALHECMGVPKRKAWLATCALSVLTVVASAIPVAIGAAFQMKAQVR